jgi:uncharacterized protein
VKQFLPRTLLAAIAAVALAAAPAFARESYVDDGANMIGASAISQINSEVGAFNARTGKEVVVVTVPSLNGATLQDAAEKTFAAKQVNGVLIFLAKSERQGGVMGDKAAKAFFPPGTFQNIYDGMRGYLRSGDVDDAVKTGVNLTLDQYRSHEGALSRRQAAALPVTAPKAAALPLPEEPKKSSFGGIGLFWFLVLLVVGFFVIRAIFRAMSGPRQVPPGYQGPMPGPGGPMPGPGYGYGPGYGQPPMGGGGGGFMSGLLGGLGGAFIGNQLFGRRDEGGGFTNTASTFGGDQPAADASGWQSDAGQADTGSFGGGGWGDSGSGGGADFGSGDFGGGGDSGGGDSGGGW